MITERKEKLNLIPGGVPPVIHVSQYDTAEAVSFELWEGTKKFQKPSGATAKIEMTKPDKKGIRKDCTYAADGTIEIGLETQMTCVAGNIRSKIVIYDATGQIGTAAFILSVDPAGLADGAVVSESDLPDLREIYEQATAVEEKAKEAASFAEAAQNSASAADGSAKAAGKFGRSGSRIRRKRSRQRGRSEKVGKQRSWLSTGSERKSGYGRKLRKTGRQVCGRCFGFESGSRTVP